LNGAPTRAILRRPPGDGAERPWWRFAEPAELHVAQRVEEIVPLLELVERANRRGLWAVGYLAYEAAPAFDPALAVHAVPPASAPLAGFGLFEPPESVAAPVLDGMDDRGADGFDEIGRAGGIAAALGPEAHAAAVEAIRAAIAAGETYQVNLTFPLRQGFSGDAERLFWRLAPASAAPYAAFLDWGDTAVVSISPELFFERAGGRLRMRPMKGTRPRGRYSEEDGALAADLAASPKERAENLMIVDMVRNDLGRIAAAGSVEVERLFEIERYPTVWQMTSTIAAQSDAGLPALFGALFPCASVTGAPKARTMEWIRRLEGRRRGIYCGAIGWAAPERRAVFSVAIRTAVIDRERGELEYGVGSGVVWDSRPAAEYQECLAKGKALVDPGPSFGLFETMLWRPRCGIALLPLHLERLAASAEFFGFRLDETQLRERVESELARLADESSERRRARLELSADGSLSWTSKPFASDRRAWRVKLSDRPVESQDRRLFHKTTSREIYEAALAEARAAGCDEAILCNERGELTEGTRTNLVLEIGGERLTPARDCGLLAGVFRRSLLERGKIREAVLRREDLARAGRVLLVNSLRGWIPAELADGRR
jgi:para-aminobenzoate synthetase / 4-amino-4-deoxychorismate lyase